jgi:AcrR family transcriptional regulator
LNNPPLSLAKQYQDKVLWKLTIPGEFPAFLRNPDFPMNVTVAKTLSAKAPPAKVPPTKAPTTKPLSTRTDEDTKQRILHEAQALFFRFGFSQVTMDETAERLGMSKKTLYRFFPSKEDLLQEVTRAHLEECDQELTAICRQEGVDPLEKLKRYLNYLTALYAKMSEALLYDLQRHAPEIWNQVEGKRQECLNTHFGALIKEGRQKGHFRKDVDERLFVLIYSHVLRDILNPQVLSELPFKPNQVFDTVVKVLFQGLLTDKARTEYHVK